MAKASEQFRQSDVTTWGVVALVLAGIAVMAANVSAVIPQPLLAGLHKSRLEGATLDQLRIQVGELREEAVKLRRENSVLAARFALDEQNGSEITRRVGALEVSLPRLLENMPVSNAVDRTSTAAIGSTATLIYPAEGGSVAVRQQPMQQPEPLAPDQPLPDPVARLADIPPPTAGSFGIALGVSVPAQQAPEVWRDLSIKLGPLLFGLMPMLIDEANSDDKRIMVGPISQLSEATALCSRLERISVACLPMPFVGTPLAY